MMADKLLGTGVFSQSVYEQREYDSCALELVLIYCSLKKPLGIKP